MERGVRRGSVGDLGVHAGDGCVQAVAGLGRTERLQLAHPRVECLRQRASVNCFLPESGPLRRVGDLVGFYGAQGRALVAGGCGLARARESLPT